MGKKKRKSPVKKEKQCSISVNGQVIHASDERAKALRSLSYNEYLHTEEWIKISRRMRSLFPRCSLCGASNNLHVHHLQYPKRGKETFQDLTVLCKTCHYRYHTTFDDIQNATNAVYSALAEINEIGANIGSVVDYLVKEGLA